jgi:hypothetical protein
MRYQHDCDKCVPLGEHETADLYYCEQGGLSPTVIARYSSVPPDYQSNLLFAKSGTHLGEAKQRAVTLGLLPPD